MFFKVGKSHDSCNEAAVLGSRRDDYEPHSGTVFTLQTTV